MFDKGLAKGQATRDRKRVNTLVSETKGERCYVEIHARLNGIRS